ncbi:unnamed protein product [Fraxinus pennsylvanica]|uniref:Senescence regulator n=1 Tax=Fraxinus pennsylvanica TaxID=56036 RepID=A0AAD1ZPY3_9LAMI|nr:unnamed protein product [Fraxinus pennsylvanica]
MSMYRRSRKSQSRNEEFQEQDLWEVVNERKEPSFTSKRQPTAARIMIRTDNKNHNIDEPRTVQNSAPVSIPDWSKIYGESSKNGNGDDFVRSSWESDGDEDEDDDGNLIPPHEFIARKLARKQISSFSVCEGAGRTLKGRDLSTVRNAILTKTGFLE